MSQSKIVLQSFEKTIAAGGRWVVDAYSKMLTIVSNSGGDEIYVGIGDLRPVPLYAGFQYELPQGESFNRIAIENRSASSTTVKIILSVGLVHDNRLTISGTVFDNILDQLKGDTTPVNWGTERTIGITYGIIVAANTNRRAVVIQSKSTNTGLIYLGFASSVTTAKWFAELQPGQSVSFDNYQGDIYAIATVAGQLVGWAEV